MRQLFVVKIRNTEGVIVGEISLEEPENRSSGYKDRAPSFRQHSTSDEMEAKPITDAQRRMLYRLALKLGHQGDAARQFIESRLAAFGNGNPDRKTASHLIDKLQTETGNGNDKRGGHATA